MDIEYIKEAQAQELALHKHRLATLEDTKNKMMHYGVSDKSFEEINSYIEEEKESINNLLNVIKGLKNM